jgi:Uma2 family endonuclease
MTNTLMINTEEAPGWLPPPPPTDLIFDDGEPLESNRHRIAMNTLIDSYQNFRGNETNYFTGGNMFIYYSSAQVRNRDYKGPDFFVVLNVDGDPSRQGWVVWEEGGRYPDVIVELLSPSTAQVDRTTKKTLYEQVFRTRNYFIYDPFDPTQLTGWKLMNGSYQPIDADARGWLWSEVLGLWLAPWAGVLNRETAFWLRFYDAQGNLVLLPKEAAQAQAEQANIQAKIAQEQAETERLRAETAERENAQLRERLQSLGIIL